MDEEFALIRQHGLAGFFLKLGMMTGLSHMKFQPRHSGDRSPDTVRGCISAAKMTQAIGYRLSPV